MSLSVFFPYSPTNLQEFVDFALTAERLGLEAVWLGHSLTFPPEVLIGAAVSSGCKLRFGVAVQLISLSNPVGLAFSYASLSLQGVPLSIAFGPGGKDDGSFSHGFRFKSPLTAMSEFLRIFEAARAGRPLKLSGEYFSTDIGAMRPRGPSADFEIGAGVLGPKMATLARGLCDFGVTWMASARYLNDTLLPAGSQSYDSGFSWKSLVAFAVTDERDDLNISGVVTDTCGGHAALGHYRRSLQRAGVVIDQEGDIGYRALIDGGVFLLGDRDEVASQMQEYVSNGSREVILNCSGILFRYGRRAFWTQIAAVASSEKIGAS